MFPWFVSTDINNYILGYQGFVESAEPVNIDNDQFLHKHVKQTIILKFNGIFQTFVISFNFSANCLTKTV